MQKAKDESWGCWHRPRTITRRRASAQPCAVEQEYKYLRAWCRDDWVYVGVVLSIWEDEDTEVDDHAASLWGIECGYEDASAYKSWEYLTSVANDLLAEYQHQHPEALIAQPEADEPEDEDYVDVRDFAACSAMQSVTITAEGAHCEEFSL